MPAGATRSILYSAPRRRTAEWLGPHVWAGVAAAIVGVALSVAAWFAVCLREDRLAELELRERASGHAQILQNGINDNLGKLAAVRALFQASSSEVARGEFVVFSEW